MFLYSVFDLGEEIIEVTLSIDPCNETITFVTTDKYSDVTHHNFLTKLLKFLEDHACVYHIITPSSRDKNEDFISFDSLSLLL